MKKNALKYLVIFSLCPIYFIVIACNSKTQASSSDSHIQTSPLPQNIAADSLSRIYTPIVVEHHENKSAMKINYCNPDNTNEVLFERHLYNNGKIFMEGPIKNNKRNGEWIAWYDNGVIWSVGHYENGLKHGSSNVYYTNGQIRYTKNYDENVSIGIWYFYDPDGNEIGKVEYDNGKIISQEGKIE